MTDKVEALSARFNLYITNDDILTVSQLKEAAIAVQQYAQTATKCSVLNMLEILLKLMAGEYYEDSDTNLEMEIKRYIAWISGSDEDRTYFMFTITSMAAHLRTCIEITPAPRGSPARRQTALIFNELFNLKIACRGAKSVFKEAARQLHQVEAIEHPVPDPDFMNFLYNLKMCMLQAMEKIASIIPIEKMKDCLHSDHESNELDESLFDLNISLLKYRGEITEFLFLPERCFDGYWSKLFIKVDRTSNMDYLFLKATNLTCMCGRNLGPDSTCAILDSCRDLLCVQCARVTFSVRRPNQRTCPRCRVPTMHWITNDNFNKLKISMKKRKYESV